MQGLAGVQTPSHLQVVSGGIGVGAWRRGTGGARRDREPGPPIPISVGSSLGQEVEPVQQVGTCSERP